MASFDYCKKCEFPRHIEGYQGIGDYINNGWVQFMTVTTRRDLTGIRHDSAVTTWLCPVCAEAEAEDRKALMEIGSAMPEKRGRYGSVRNERST